MHAYKLAEELAAKTTGSSRKPLSL
jgi:hypothetical protein